MIFIETPWFTRQVLALLPDEEYGAFQCELAANPEAGDVIEGTGGLRKVRVAAKGRGKRGGARVIYYHFAANARMALLAIYAKGEKDDLTAAERKTLRAIIEHWR